MTRDMSMDEVDFGKFPGGSRGSGIHTTCIPADRAASTPFGESSNTKTLSEESGGILNLLAVVRNISGIGLPCLT